MSMYDVLIDAVRKTEAAPEPFVIKATDGIDLAVRVYEPRDVKAVLLFCHGGGSSSRSGYQLIGRRLAQEYSIQVYTPDIRGHGLSGGPRGDTPSVDQVNMDMNTILEYIMSKPEHQNVPIFLGGHSSGAGMALNYATWPGRNDIAKNLQGVLLLSPRLGRLAKEVEKPDANFATVTIRDFILNAMFGVRGHNHAVQFDFPPQVLEQNPSLVTSITVNMANATSPRAPKAQCQDIPNLQLWVGEDDELFYADKVASYVEGAVVLPGELHLGILINAADKAIGPWILQQIQ